MERPELEREWLIGGFVPGGSVIGLVAAGGTGKTLLAYDLVKAIASGQAWNDLPVSQGKCLVIQADEQWTDTVDRLDIAGFRELDPDSVHFVEHWQFAQLPRLADYVREQDIKFCVIDSFTSTNRRSAAEEKDTAYAKCLYDLRDLASETGCTFLVLHHTNKAGGARGTTAFEDNVSEVWFLTREKAEGFTPHHRQLEIRKSRSGCTGKYKLFLDVDDYSWKWEGDLDEIPGSKPLMTRVLEYLQQCPGVWVEPDELCHVFSAPKSRDAMRKALERLRKKGLVVAEDRVKVCNERGGKTRYKVYMYPDPNVQRHQTRSQTASWSLDASLDNLDSVQRQNGLKPAPRAKSVSLDAPENHQLPQLAQVAQRNPAYDQEVKPAPRMREESGDLSLDAGDIQENVQRQDNDVQRPEPAPRAENLSLDTSSPDTQQNQLAQVAHSPAPGVGNGSPPAPSSDGVVSTESGWEQRALDAVGSMFDGVVVQEPIQQSLDLEYSSRNDCQFQQYFQYSSREVPKIKVGDKVLYVGRGENGLFTIKGLGKEILTVLAVDHDLGVARVTSPNWNFMPNYQTIDLKHLKRI